MKLHSLFLLLFLLTGCSALALLAPTPAPLVERPVQYLPGSSFDSTITNGLSNDDRKTLYSLDTGIQYLPINVMLSLKRTDPSGFRVMDELLFQKPERFGLLPNYIDPQSEIPLGITVSTDPHYAPMGGINCATCHTGLISNARGEFFLVDGGSSRFAVDRFIAEMVKSLVATLINPAEFDAFYNRYQLRSALTEKLENSDQTRKDMAELVKSLYTTGNTVDVQKAINDIAILSGNKSTSLASSYPTEEQLSSRLGMYVYLTKRFLYFFSQTKYGTKIEGSTVSDSGLGRSNPWAVAKKMFADRYLHTSNGPKLEGGPVNTPFNWDFNRQRLIFWDGVTNSMLERNLAQGVTLVTDFNNTTFETTVSIRGLKVVSDLSAKARAPKWATNILGDIDQGLAVKGKTIFQNNCLGCHDPMYNKTETGSAEYNYVDVGTDDSYYKGQMELVDGKSLFTQIIAPFINRVKITGAKNEKITDLASYETGRFPILWQAPRGNAPGAKPLAGIWATPPFLHNGSVPTIWDLLQPAAQRPKHFHIGGYVYDSKKLGYIEDTSLPDGFDFNVSCAVGCGGNDNRGHEFGTNLSDDDKWALIEFMKVYSSDTQF